MSIELPDALLTFHRSDRRWGCGRRVSWEEEGDLRGLGAPQPPWQGAGSRWASEPEGGNDVGVGDEEGQVLPFSYLRAQFRPLFSLAAPFIPAL